MATTSKLTNWFTKLQNTLPDFSIKALKTWQGPDGPGYQGTLLYKEKTAATFHQDGNGGETQIAYFNEDYRTLITQKAGNLPDPISTEMLIAIVTDKYTTVKKLKRDCQKHTLIIKPSYKEGEFNKIKLPFSEPTKAKILQQEPHAFFINEHI